MLNRPHSHWEAETRGTGDCRPAGLDGNPRLRLAVLFGFLVLPVGLIAARFVHVQLHLTGRYTQEFERSTERLESIPSRDGRILSADGQVLAEDVEVFHLKVHYRWIEDPPDPAWLKSLVLRRLDRPARRDQRRVAAETERVLAERESLWSRLALHQGLDAASLKRERAVIQQRVEKIYAGVLAARERRTELTDRSRSEVDAEFTSGWYRLWNGVVTTLTTPPRREATEPLVIQEQLDYHLLCADIPFETAVEIEGHPEHYPGTRIEVSARRVYPQGELAAHVLGYREAVSEEMLAARRERFPGGDPLDYQLGDRMGVTGLERHYERHLRGLRGQRALVLNRRGEIISERVVREPRFGRDLVISLSVELQLAAEKLLDGVLSGPQIDETNGLPLPTPPGGAIVALDVRTGAVLAAASGPRFDPRILIEHDSQGWQAIQGDERQPLFHRAIEMALPPGSVFKVVSAIGFLESGRLDPERPFTCLGYLDNPERYRCYSFKHYGVGHGDVNLVSALARSCNVYFFDAARRIGAEPLADWADRFGLGQLTGIDLPGERAGSVPSISTPAPGRRTQRQFSGEALQLAIGQGKLTATPLQIARLMAAVANGGRMVTPRLAQTAGPTRLDDDEATEQPLLSAPEPSEVPDLSRGTLHAIQRGLLAVVASPQGTGHKTVRLDGVQIAGKTGTAEPGGGKPDHAWFAGYVPAQNPRVAFVVVLQHAGPGGHAAGPVARKFVQSLVDQGLTGSGTRLLPSAN